MTDQVRISVGVSTLSRPQALARCLDALLSGRVRPAEIVVVDQGSGAAADAVVEERQSSEVPIRLVRQARLGLSASRNEIIHLAREELLAITDDDCVPGIDWLAAIIRAFAAPPEPDAVTGRVLPLGPARPGLYAISLRTSAVRRDFTAPVLPWRVGTGANFAVRRARILHVGGYDERLGAGSPGCAAEDLDLYHRLLRAGARIRYEPAALVYHERQTLQRRMATRRSYGHGIGAACAIHCRGRDWFGAVILAAWLRWVAACAGKAAAARDLGGLRQAWASLAGCVCGLGYGWRVCGRRRAPLPWKRGVA